MLALNLIDVVKPRIQSNITFPSSSVMGISGSLCIDRSGQYVAAR